MKKKKYISPDFEVVYFKARHRLLNDSSKSAYTKKDDIKEINDGKDFD